jgi:predicted TIM-barrel fold metal-dependent hydrolase
MPSRVLDFPVFDVDNHMYETTAAFTKFLPAEYDGYIRYVEVNGRTKIAVRNVISDYIPNPTFEVVAAPGAQEEYFKVGNPEGRSRREIMGKAIRSIPAYREPEPRLELMDQLGIDRTMMWPTLASLLEERLSDDPVATHVVIHALNQWMHEHWTFDYRGRIFPVPVIALNIVDRAIEELEWVLERGARAILIRPAPVPGFMGRRSMALPEFDPFWKHVAEAQIFVGMHGSDSGYQRYVNDWEGHRDEYAPFQAGSAFGSIMTRQHRPMFDTVSSLIGHGLCSRFPELKIAPIETGSAWVRPLLEDLAHVYSMAPRSSTRTPSRSSGATSTSTRSTRRTRSASSGSSDPSGCSSGPTIRTPRGWQIRSASSTSSRVSTNRLFATSWEPTSLA